MVPSLASFLWVFVPPTEDALRDIRKRNMGRGNKEIYLERSETASREANSV